MAKGGSQLSQLKSSVRSAGVDDRRQQSNAAKKRKRGNAGNERDEAAARREALAKISGDRRFNPFDEKVTKQKHEVLGQKVKGAVGRPALAKQGGVAQRRATLLPEYQNRHKSGTFIDRRFGESDSTLTPEERALERFTREKQRQAKGKKAALFNLNDDDAEGQEEELTHFGRSLSGMGNLPELSMLDDPDDSNIDAEVTDAGHFGGFEAEPSDADRKKSKAEVMKEIMAKSKMHKHERQQMRDADEDLRMELDDQLGDIRSLLMAGPSTSKADASTTDKAKPANSAYDAFVRELAFERRAKPQDRLKTEAEQAEEEAEQLRKAEEDRLRRMRGEDVIVEGSKKGNRRAPQGDDLDDDLDIDGQTAADQYGLGDGIGASDEEEEEEQDDEEEEEEEEDESGDSEGSDEEQDPALEDEEFGEALSDDDGEEQEGNEAGHASLSTVRPGASKKSNGVAKKGKAAAKALPFTFSCPTEHADFLEILEEHDIEPSQVPLVIKRIRALHHPSLAEDNKYRLQGFLGVLLDHSLWCATQAFETAGEERKAHLTLIEHLLKHITDLTSTYPTASAQYFVEKLSFMERNLNRGLAKGALLPEARTWPGAPELTLLRIAGLIWPTSDQNHPVATPLALLCSHYLAHCRVRNLADVASGLYLSSLILHQQDEAKRLVPEALNSVQNAVMLLAPLSGKGKDLARAACSQFGIPSPDFGQAHAHDLALSYSAKGSQLPSPKPARLYNLLAATSSDTQSKVDLLGMALSLAERFGDLYFGTGAFIELFEPLLRVLQSVSWSALPSSLADQISKLSTHLKDLTSETQKHRQPLQLHAHRAIPLASFIPKFDEGGRSRGGHGAWDPDSARSEAAKLKSLIKKERKGAVRELRKDSQFLAQERAREKRAEDADYKRKMGKIMAGLGEERSEEKQLAKEKARLKKKAGK
ncbi:unnamed protein product [Sympodiomycopsis kandeliae]